MQKVFESIDFVAVGHAQSILEENGIATELRNLGASQIMGEIPFTECFPELWVLEDGDYDRARALLQEMEPPPEATSGPWVCPGCGEPQEPAFGSCWKCGTLRPASGT